MIQLKTVALFGFLIFGGSQAQAQKSTSSDSLPDYNILFSDLQGFLDSITRPRSFFTANASISTGYFQFQTSNQRELEEQKQLVVAPAVGYYHKSGFGLSGAASLINYKKPFLLYQGAATASYDYLKNRAFVMGIAYTYFFTKPGLPFYTSPLNQQVNVYASLRRLWLKPALAAGFGWGSTTTLQQQKVKLKLLKGKNRNATVETETTESIADVSFSASVRHDFYWRKVLAEHDYFKLSPQLIVNGGTQKFGLAQTNTTFVSAKRSSNTILYGSQKSFIAQNSGLQVISASARLRAEYSRNIYFVQPQLLLDYFFTETDGGLQPGVVLNVGILF